MLKRFLISALAAVFITVIIPIIISGLVKPESNADSTIPQPVETAAAESEQPPI